MRVMCTGRRELPENWDGPEAVNTACGATFEVEIPEGDPGLTETWDVNVDKDGNVIRRHKSVLCPYCGTATFVIEGEDV